MNDLIRDTEPAAPHAAEQEETEESIKDFLNAHLVVSRGAEIHEDDLYAAYLQWYDAFRAFQLNEKGQKLWARLTPTLFSLLVGRLLDKQKRIDGILFINWKFVTNV